MTVSFWQPVPDPIRAEHDDVVIGAGIVGSYAAWILKQRGRDVALVDARHPAAGASGPSSPARTRDRPISRASVNDAVSGRSATRAAIAVMAMRSVGAAGLAGMA